MVTHYWYGGPEDGQSIELEKCQDIRKAKEQNLAAHYLRMDEISTTPVLDTEIWFHTVLSNGKHVLVAPRLYDKLVRQ